MSTEIKQRQVRRFKIFQAYLLLVVLSGCSVKHYEGPELPDNQLATISLKAPIASLIPIFWIFPFNMFLSFSDDWVETKRSGITLDGIALNKDGLTRFKKIKILPKIQRVMNLWEVRDSEHYVGSERCSTESISGYDGMKEKSLTTVTKACCTDYMVEYHEEECELNIDAKADNHYELFVRNQGNYHNIISLHIESNTTQYGNCYRLKGHSYTSPNCKIEEQYKY